MKIQNYIPIKKVIYDNKLDYLFEKEFDIIIDNKNIKFKVSDFQNNNFENLNTMFMITDYENLIKQGSFDNSPPNYYLNFMTKIEYSDIKKTHKYHSENLHLDLKYLIIDDLLMIFTYGEKQSSRWILIIEGAWKISYSPS